MMTLTQFLLAFVLTSLILALPWLLFAAYRVLRALYVLFRL